MTFERNDDTRGQILAAYQGYVKANGHSPSSRILADELGMSLSKVKYYVHTLEVEGKVTRIKKAAVQIDQRKAYSMDTYAKKSEAGKAGAKRLREVAEKNGVMPSALARIPALDDGAVKARIDRIVENAKQNGTYCHPRPKVVVLIGQKAG